MPQVDNIRTSCMMPRQSIAPVGVRVTIVRLRAVRAESRLAGRAPETVKVQKAEGVTSLPRSR